MHAARLVALGLLLAAGCQTPPGLYKVGLDVAYRPEDLRAPGPGFLRAYDPDGSFERDPLPVLRRVHRDLAGDPRRLLALGDLCYATAGRSWIRTTADQRRTLHLSAAVYAYFYLAAGAPERAHALQLYNRSLARYLTDARSGEVRLEKGVRPWLAGTVHLRIVRASFGEDPRERVRLLAAPAFGVRRIARHRTAGLGVPLIAVRSPADVSPGRFPPELSTPATLLLRPERLADDLAATLELHDPLRTPQADVGGPLPLAADWTGPFAHTMDAWDPADYRLLGLFRSRHVIDLAGIYLLRPYEPGKIPVVFLHGLASQPGRWSGVVNALLADRDLREGYQPWLVLYPSGQPWTYTGALIREDLLELHALLRHRHADPALERMVVVGHSMGGLIARLLVTGTGGDELWRSVCAEPLTALDAEPEEREIARVLFFFAPLPFVRRVVFVSTPHRGSAGARNPLAILASSSLALPVRLERQLGGLVERNKDAFGRKDLRATLAPESPAIQRVASLPIGVPYHSIIARRDGVVAYESAHLEGAASERVVDSGHNAHRTEAGIDEIKRILRRHLTTRP
ncbi:MAG: esterase/lipase family protein [Planctomycetota bacterium]|jgi:pimeloyl-ACP methyl ester carboxylesterase